MTLILIVEDRRLWRRGLEVLLTAAAIISYLPIRQTIGNLMESDLLRPQIEFLFVAPVVGVLHVGFFYSLVRRYISSTADTAN